MSEPPYDRIAAGLRAHGARLVVATVPESTPLVAARDGLMMQLRARGVRFSLTRIDPDADLAGAIERGSSDSTATAVLLFGLDELTRADAENSLRRSNFMRARLKAAPIPALLVVPGELWSWACTELPDLARWADGPFELPAVGTGSHPLASIGTLAQRLGFPFRASLDAPLDAHRGVELEAPLSRALGRSGLLVVGGHRGTGVGHLLARLEHRLRCDGVSTAFPPSATRLDGRLLVGGEGMNPGDSTVPWPATFEAWPFVDWLDQNPADVVLVPRKFRREAFTALLARGRTGILGGYASEVIGQAERPLVEFVYLPAVDVGNEVQANTAGVQALIDALGARVSALGHRLDAVFTDDAAMHLVRLSGGSPGLLWQLAELASQRASISAEFPVTRDVASIAALDFSRAWLRGARSPGIPDDDTVQEVIGVGGVDRRRHPLALLAAAETPP